MNPAALPTSILPSRLVDMNALQAGRVIGERLQSLKQCPHQLGQYHFYRQPGKTDHGKWQGSGHRNQQDAGRAIFGCPQCEVAGWASFKCDRPPRIHGPFVLTLWAAERPQDPNICPLTTVNAIELRK